MKYLQCSRFSVLALAIAAVCQTATVQAAGYEVKIDTNKLTTPAESQAIATYIVQLVGKSGVEKAADLGQLTPNNAPVGTALNLYDSTNPQIVAYNAGLKQLQQKLASQFSNTGLIYSYTHTFNGFSARMTAEQASQLRMHPDVVGVWEDKPEQVTTSRTPALLGLTGPDGQHTLGIKGENIIVGIVDTGISPANPSFADDGSYAPLARFKGTCDKGQDADFACNNKMIGARYFKDSFQSVYAIQPGEFISPRDADSHGSHTASTAAGNANVAASIGGQSYGNITGIAPRARIAVYKACWNSDYVSPAGAQERGCFYGDTMAAIDAAVADGVDVINYSIGGSRTDLTTISVAAKLRATQAGVLVSVSAGNDGGNNAIETVGTPAPWVVSVAASGFSVNAIGVNSGLGVNKMTAIEGTVTKPLSVTGAVTGNVVVAQPALGCTPLTNAADVAGKVVLIQRGTCGFADKVLNAQNAGAKAILAYNNAAGNPIAMGGTVASGPTIPGVMVSLGDGATIAAAVNGGTTVNVTLDPNQLSNAMADFSSKGPNKASYDILKPDITAPGVNVLAAATPTTFTKPKGNDFTFMSGTSMSSPHIAGMAALLIEQHPDWTPAMVKSALMTTSHQNVTKASSSVLADPFDFGAGHAAPVKAMDPGLVYDASALDYYAFLCGIGNTAFVKCASGFDCAAYVAAGYPTDATQLNYPSISVSQLKAAKTVVRVVTNVGGSNANYRPVIQAPAGVDVVFKTLNATGQLVEASSLDVPANGKAVYALTLTPTSGAVLNKWAFGSLTLTDGVHNVRSPLVVKPMEPDAIIAPGSLTTQVAAASGRVSFTADMSYSGVTSGKLFGLSQAFGTAGTATQDPDKTFGFNEATLGTHILTVPAGTQVARFTLRNGLTNLTAPDMDLYVYRCVAWSCSSVAVSQNAEANEDIVLRNPAPANNAANGDVYIVWAHARDLKGAAKVNYTLAYWIVDKANTATSTLTASTRAVKGRPNVITVSTKNLVAGALPYMGVVTLHDAKGTARTSTLLEVFAK